MPKQSNAHPTFRSCLERSEAISSARALLDTWTPDALDEARGLFYMVNGWLPDEETLKSVEVSEWFREKMERLAGFADRCFQTEEGDGIGFVRWAEDEACGGSEHPGRDGGKEGCEGALLLSIGAFCRGVCKDAVEPVGELDQEVMRSPQKLLQQAKEDESQQFEDFPLPESDDFGDPIHTEEAEWGAADVNAGHSPEALDVDGGEVAARSAETLAKPGQDGGSAFDGVPLLESGVPSGPVHIEQASGGDGGVNAGGRPKVVEGIEVAARNAESPAKPGEEGPSTLDDVPLALRIRPRATEPAEPEPEPPKPRARRPRATVGRLLRDVCALANAPRALKAEALRVVQYRRGMRAVGLDAHGALALLDAVERAAGAHFARVSIYRFGLAFTG